MDGATPQTPDAPSFRDFLTILRAYKWRWIVPAVVISVAVGLYANQMPETWEAWQAVIVRNNAAAQGAEPGEFRSTDPMKRLEDTIAEIGMSSRVLHDALVQVGPPEGWEATDDVAGEWPSEKDIAKLRKSVSIEAPNGAEFGTTEVFYIKAQDESLDRSEQLVSAIFTHLKNRMGELRDERAQGMVTEVEKTVELANEDLHSATKELREMEQSVGEDLVELRMLHQSPNGQGDLTRSLIGQEQEILRLESSSSVTQYLLDLLKTAKEDPGVLESAPPELLQAHPQLRSLCEALLESELRLASLQKNLTLNYPTVKAALAEKEGIRKRLFAELDSANKVVAADLQLQTGRLQILNSKRDELHTRIGKLAAVRADYTNLANLVRHRQQELETAEHRLADVRAQRAVAQSTSIISQLDSPGRSQNPLGPSRATVTLVGIFGGLMSGFGLVFMTVMEQPSSTAPRSAPTPSPLPDTRRTPSARLSRRDPEEAEADAAALAFAQSPH